MRLRLLLDGFPAGEPCRDVEEAGPVPARWATWPAPPRPLCRPRRLLPAAGRAADAAAGVLDEPFCTSEMTRLVSLATVLAAAKPGPGPRRAVVGVITAVANAEVVTTATLRCTQPYSLMFRRLPSCGFAAFTMMRYQTAPLCP